MFPPLLWNACTGDLDDLPAFLPGLVTAGTLLVAFGLLAADSEYFWVAFVLGFGVVLPVATGLAAGGSGERTRHSSARRAHPPGTDEDSAAALAELRHRYATRQLTDAEFELRVERLLETDPPDRAADTVPTGRT
jgi:hypothetical protein